MLLVNGKYQPLHDILFQAEATERHHHNRERWYGISNDQTGNNWSTESRLMPFRAISGAGIFGVDANDEAKVIGSDDTPMQAGMTLFDFHRIMVTAVSNANESIIRIIWGTGTMADAEMVGQYSDAMLTEARKGSPITILTPRIASGTKVWARHKNGVNNATIDFYLGLHEYEE